MMFSVRTGLVFAAASCLLAEHLLLAGWLQSRLLLHVLVQLPLLVLLGWYWAMAIHERWQNWLNQFNRAGITGCVILTLRYDLLDDPASVGFVTRSVALRSGEGRHARNVVRWGIATDIPGCSPNCQRRVASGGVGDVDALGLDLSSITAAIVQQLLA